MAEVQDIKVLLKKIDKGELPQSALVFGEETYFIDKLIEKLEEVSRKKSLDIVKISANDVKLNELLDLVEQNPLFSKGKILVVKEFGKLIKSSSAKDDTIEDDVKPSKASGMIKLFVDYLRNPNPATFLFLTHPDRVDMRLKFYKDASKLIQFFQSKKIYEKEIFEFIEQKFKEHNIKIDTQTIDYIYKTVGTNLYDLESELNRLFISIEGLNKIDINTIKNYIIPIRKYSIFDLLNAFRDKDISNALEIGLNLIENNSPLVYIITMLQKYFFSLLTFNELRKTYQNDEKIASIIGCHPYFLKDYETASKRYKFEELEKIFDILLKKDIELKSLNLKEDVLYTSMISEIGLAIKKI
ncbi:MAG: DNA polymerase III subunit delta [Ignavibacterium sp.]|nr:DNA polymerase III subunit delta [Ignavibacterium sp.]